MRIRPASRLLLLLLALVVAIVAFAIARGVARQVIAARIRREAGSRGLSADCSTLSFAGLAHLRLTGLTLAAVHGDTLFRAESLLVSLDPWSLVRLSPHVEGLELAHARVRWR